MRKKILTLLLILTGTLCFAGCNGCRNNADENFSYNESSQLSNQHDYCDWFSFYSEGISATIYMRGCLDCEIVEYKLSNEETGRVYSGEEFQQYINATYFKDIHIHRNIRAEQGVPPTCTSQGYSYEIWCNDCNDKIDSERVDALGHEWEIIEQITTCKTKQSCKRCKEEREYNSHDLAIEITEPTCTKAGVHVTVCTRCDYIQEKELDALGHNWRLAETEAATCTQTGLNTYKCYRCNEEKEENIAILPHSWEIIGYIAATESENGMVKLRCRRCEEQMQLLLHWITNSDSCMHNWEILLDIKATCTENGIQLFQCKTCQKIKDEYFDALEHEWKEIERKEPTCTLDGYSSSLCNRCGERKQETLLKRHKFAFSFNEHIHIRECICCQETYEELHDLFFDMETIKRELEAVIEYTTIFFYECYGFETYAFDNCDYRQEITRHSIYLPQEEEIEETYFERLYLKEVLNPTCTEEGLFILKFRSTGEEISRTTIPATGHWYDYDGICMRCGCEYYTEGLSYELSEDETFYRVTGIGTATDKDIVIPSKHKDLPVKEIKNYCFYENTTITSVIIPNSVVEIGDGAFAKCVGLTKVTIPESVTSFGYLCFSLCPIEIARSSTLGIWEFSKYNLIELEIISGSSIERNLFTSATNLTSLIISDSVAFIDVEAFYKCTSLTSILINENNTIYKSKGNCIIEIKTKTLIRGCKTSIIPTDGSVTTIGGGAFKGCTDLTNMTIPNGVTTIGVSEFNVGAGVGAFSGCTDLTNVVIPNSVTSIGKNTFSGCINLANIVIPNSVISMGEDAFVDCVKLIKKENNVSYVAKWAIDCDSSVTAISLRNDTKGIADGAFYHCTTLKSIAIPNSLIVIGREVFIEKQAKSVYINSMQAWCQIDFSDNPLMPNGILYLNGEIVRNLIIPEGTTKIEELAFVGCISIISVTIPQSIETIGDSAFWYCRKIVEVVNKSNLTFSGGVVDEHGYLWGYARQVIESETESKIIEQDDYIFYHDYDFYHDGIFYNESYYLLGYKGKATELILPEKIHNQSYKIYQYAFASCFNLIRVIIPNSVDSIKAGTFYGCTNLTIYAEIGEKPSGWLSNWNLIDASAASELYCPVEWGYTGE